MKFENRADAGRKLAASLQSYAAAPNLIVLGLPRGGVPVAYEVSRSLRAPLDVFLVRKIGMPSHPEVAMGAIAEGGVRVLNQHLVDEANISKRTVDEALDRERVELERRTRRYRDGRALPTLKGRTIILVDDGLATGATMEVAVRALRQLTDGKIIAAAPVGAPDTCRRLRGIADAVVCAFIPEVFTAVGLWYEQFDQTTDEEVRQFLTLSRDSRAGAANDSPRRDLPSLPHREIVDIARAHAWRLTGDPAQ